MGSIMSAIECPYCQNEEAVENYYYKTNELIIMCQRCGYYYESFLRRTENGEVIKDGDTLLYTEIEYEKPGGIITIEYENGIKRLFNLESETVREENEMNWNEIILEEEESGATKIELAWYDLKTKESFNKIVYERIRTI